MMNSRTVIRTYLSLTLFNTLAASLIWGINTLFLLDAGLSIVEAFAANAFFTIGMVLFEIPTGVIADSKGRRLSYILGVLTLAVTTFLYLVLAWVDAPFLYWAIVSLFLGLGFTFFSGATDAWLADALKATKHTGPLDRVFGKGQIVGGAAMLVGSIAGGLIAQATDLGVPYLVRVVLLLITLVIAVVYMRDLGFTPEKYATYRKAVRSIVSASIKHGLGVPRVRWMMISSPFVVGVSIYIFYALQPYLLELYGDSTAYWVAGLVAAIVAGAQICGGLLVPVVRRLVKSRTKLLFISTLAGAMLVMVLSLIPNFYIVVGLIVLWAMISAATTPVRQAYLNELIPSRQRATVLSFDSLLGSSGGVASQPALGRVADVWGYAPSFMVAGALQLLALPFLALAHRSSRRSDPPLKE